MLNLNFAFKGIAITLISVLFLFSCSDENPITNPVSEVSPLEFKLFLTDCPFEAEEVNVEIVKVSLEDYDGNVEELTTNAGIYNLLEFTDGVDTLLASGSISIEDIKHINFELGENNTIVVEGETFPLELKNGNIVKIKVNLDQIDNDDYLIDFMACTSIIRNNNGYFLKPVIKFKGKRSNPQGGDIEDLIEDIEECYELVYPIALLDEEGENHTANDQEELIDIFNELEIDSIVYPFSVLSSEGEIIEIGAVDDAEELEDCDDDEDENESELDELLEELEECYRFEYPVSVVDFDGINHSANNIEELESIIDENNIEDFVYPVTVYNADGENFIMQMVDDFGDLDDDCDDEEEENEIDDLIEDLEDCYTFSYPIELLDFDGNTFVANDEDELEDLVRENNIKDFSYPVDLSNEAGDIFTILSYSEFDSLEDCDDDENDNEFEELIEELTECYKFEYPVILEGFDGNNFAANDLSELQVILTENEIENFDYPVIVIDENGETFTAHNINQFNLLDDCDSDYIDWDDVVEDVLECYSIIYPISFVDEDGNTLSVNDEDELEDLFEENDIEELVYPIQLTDDDGNTIDINEFQDFGELDLDC